MSVLEARGLIKRFKVKGEEKTVVDDVSLSIEGGQILGFLGRNGAGKTTTIKMIASLIRPTAGSIRVMGEDPHSNPATLRQIGAVLEGSRNVYWRFTAEENLEYFGALRGLSRAEARRRGVALLERFGLAGVKNVPLMQFSRGMQQKTAIAVALLHEPKLLLLDEPTIALDVEAAEQVKAIVREVADEGRAVLLTTHQLDVAEEVSSRIAIIDAGKLIVEQATDELLRRFSGRAYRVQFHGELSESQRRDLDGLPVEVNGQSLVYRGAPADLYDVLDKLRPLTLTRVNDDRDTLTKIFLDLVNEERS